MTIQFRHFSIPAHDPAAAEEELNTFLRSVRVLTVHHQFGVSPHSPCWFVAVEYQEAGAGQPADRGRRKTKDYKELLPPEDFALFTVLRDWRKQQAEQEQVPVYTIFTNEQLARLAGTRPASAAQLKEIEGIGEARVQKYSGPVLEIINKHTARQRETAGKSVPENH